MAQETELWEQETNLEREKTIDSHKEDNATGSDLPSGDGNVGDEQVNAITDDGSDKETGQDHSTENHEQNDPDSGVGAIQDREDTLSDVAKLGG